MKALFVLFNNAFSPRQHLFINTLNKMGWSVDVITWKRSKGNDNNLYNEYINNWWAVEIIAPVGKASLIKYLPKYLYKAKTILLNKEYDLIFITHYFCLPLMLFAKSKYLIYDAAEIYALELSWYFGRLNKLFYTIIKYLEAIMVRKFDGIITVDSKNNFLEQFYKNHNRNVEVLWNVPSFQQEPDIKLVTNLKKRYANRKVIVYTGGLMREKGLRVAIKAAASVKAKHPEALFLFIGPMKDNPEVVEELIKELNITNNIEFLKPMQYSKMLAYLKIANVGLALHQIDRIYPFVSTGNGRKFFSYMQAGIPIIGPSFSEVGQAVRLANCGILIDTENHEEVAAAICYLLDNPEESLKLAKNGRKAFEERFNWEIESNKFIRFIHKIVSNNYERG